LYEDKVIFKNKDGTTERWYQDAQAPDYEVYVTGSKPDSGTKGLHPDIAALAPNGKPTNAWVAQFLIDNPNWNRDNPGRFVAPMLGAVRPDSAVQREGLPGWFAPAEDVFIPSPAPDPEPN